MTRLVEIAGLNIQFTGQRTVFAVNDLSLSLAEGEVLGLLGESGSGKSHLPAPPRKGPQGGRE